MKWVPGHPAILSLLQYTAFVNTTQSQQRLLVSTILLTKNSAQSLGQYFASMKRVDDIIVLDGGSTDATLDLCQAENNVRVQSQPSEYLDHDGFIIDFSGVRNFGYSLAKHRWILCIDADEMADPRLLDEVSDVIQKGQRGVYYCKRQFTYNGRNVVQFAVSSSDHLRLFHLDCVRGCVKPVHERLDVLPHTSRYHLHTSVIVPLPDARRVRPKYDRYLRIELMWREKQTWSVWLRWSLFRNVRSISSQILVWLCTFLIPRRGPRYPLSLLIEQVRYLWLVTWYGVPLHACIRARTSQTHVT